MPIFAVLHSSYCLTGYGQVCLHDEHVHARVDRLAAFICGHEVFQISVSSTYGMADFRENLLRLYTKVSELSMLGSPCIARLCQMSPRSMQGVSAARAPGLDGRTDNDLYSC